MTGTNGKSNGTDQAAATASLAEESQTPAQPSATRLTRRSLPVVKVAGDVTLDHCAATVVKAQGNVSMERSSATVLKAGGDVAVTNGAANSVRAERDVTLTGAGANLVRAGRDVQVHNGGAGAMLAGGNLEVTNGGAGLLAACGNVTLRHDKNSGSQVTLAMAGREVYVENSFVGIAISGRSALPGTRVLVNLPVGNLFEAAINAALRLADDALAWLEGSRA